MVEKTEYTEQGTYIKAHVPLRFATLPTPMRQIIEQITSEIQNQGKDKYGCCLKKSLTHSSFAFPVWVEETMEVGEEYLMVFLLSSTNSHALKPMALSCQCWRKPWLKS
ncbi:hypothetical protein S245_019928 [Arachis hypogaea]